MKLLKTYGLILFLGSLTLFSGLLFVGEFELTPEAINTVLNDVQKENLADLYEEQIVGKTYPNSFSLSWDLRQIYKKKNEELKANEHWDKVMWDNPHAFVYPLVKASAKGTLVKHVGLFFFLTFGLGIIGSLLFILPNYKLMGVAGIKNDGIYQDAATNQGWIGILACVWLVVFYFGLYFTPDYISNWIIVVNPVAEIITGGPASQWFLYGFLYCVVMIVMAIRMYIKYRNNNYQIVRTSVVLFFQIAFAFLIPEILVRLNMPYYDFKNIWPLDYDFFFDWNINSLRNSGAIGLFMLFWGIALIVVAVPVFVYFFGKRWYCSWVCGCGGLAETLGDPYRQLSSKKMWAWKFERWLIHAVLVFAIIMTGFTLFTFFTGQQELLGFKTHGIQKTYGFLIGSVFSGIIGTGFYPIFGNRVWCRFGCPLAAYLGIVQRFKSRFRITTNGGQCISCGNCSTYCEQGIDVRAYAQKGQNIVRASCVGCGICSAVCPRGVLKLENGPEHERIKTNPVLIGLDEVGFLD